MFIEKINEYKVNVQKSIGFLCTIYTKIRQLNFYNYNLKYHQIHRDKSNKDVETTVFKIIHHF